MRNVHKNGLHLFLLNYGLLPLFRENKNASVKILNLCPLKASTCVKKCAQKNLPIRDSFHGTFRGEKINTQP